MFDNAIVLLILSGIGGVGVVGVTQIIKKAIKATGALAVLISLVVSSGFTLYYLVNTATFSPLNMIGYTALVFASANGIFKATHAPSA